MRVGGSLCVEFSNPIGGPFPAGRYEGRRMTETGRRKCDRDSKYGGLGFASKLALTGVGGSFEAVFVHQVVEGGAADAEQIGGLGDAVVAQDQGALDGGAFRLFADLA